MTKHKFLRSGVKDKAPLPEQLEIGNIAINFNDENPFISFKTSENRIVTLKEHKDEEVIPSELTVNYSYGNRIYDLELPLGYTDIHFDVNSAAPFAKWELTLFKYSKGSRFPLQELYLFTGKFSTTIDTTGNYDKILCRIRITDGVMSGYAVITYNKKKYYTSDEIDNKLTDTNTHVDLLNASVSDLSYSVEQLSTKVENSVQKANYEAYTAHTESELDNKQPKGNYALREDIKTAIDGQKFKTINNESIIGEGNISITFTGGTDYDDTELKQSINANTSEISTLKGSVSGLNSSVEQLSTKVENSVQKANYEAYTASTESVLEGKQPKGNYALKSEIPQYTFKTVNGESITGEGNISITVTGGTDYDDTEIKSDINALSGQVQNLLTNETNFNIEYASYKSSVESALSDKQPKGNYALKSEIPEYTFKTINNQSIIGEGNIVITGGTGGTDYDDTELRGLISSNTSKIDELTNNINDILASI